MLHRMTCILLVLSQFQRVSAKSPKRSITDEDCGRQPFKLDTTFLPRIIGGQESAFGAWPWQISLRRVDTGRPYHLCGATLLSRSWAVTAAHCVYNRSVSNLLLVIGDHDLSVANEPLPSKRRHVQSVKIHPRFVRNTFENDIALIRFSPSVQYAANIVPACLPIDDREDFTNYTGIVTGWGRVREGGLMSNVLREASILILSNKYCKAIYEASPFRRIVNVTDTYLCAGKLEGGVDACDGDSGGPLVIRRSNQRWVLVGITSSGFGCAEPNTPAFYTRVSKYRNWIRDTVKGEEMKLALIKTMQNSGNLP